jgi:hypothetical protein
MPTLYTNSGPGGYSPPAKIRLARAGTSAGFTKTLYRVTPDGGAVLDAQTARPSRSAAFVRLCRLFGKRSLRRA